MGKKSAKKTGPTAKDIQGPAGPPPPKKPLVPSKEDIEREIRKYVKRDGGFRKDLPEADKKRCENLCKKYKREAKWDPNILPV